MSAANRVRRLISTWGTVLIVVFLLISAGAFFSAWSVYSDPPTTTVTEQRNQQSFSTAVNTSAIVTGNTTLYPAGERLVNKPVYLFSASPNLTFSVTTTTPSDTRTVVSQRLVLHMEASRAGLTFWERDELLLFDESGVTTGELTSETTVNVTTIRSKISAVQSAIGDIGTFATQIRLVVSYETDQYDGTLESSAPLVISGPGYWLGGDLTQSRMHSQTVTRQVTEPPNLGTTFGFILLGLLAIGGAAGIYYLQRQGIDVIALETELAHERYEEWISQGEFPTDPNKKYVRINSLEDLVDIAIDSNKRVVYDTDIEAYGIVDGDLVYYYSSDPRSLDVWLDI